MIGSFSTRRVLPVLIAATLLLDGCHWFHSDKVDYYKSASETRPLEVPPDLDTPSTAKELVVPGGGSSAGAAETSGAAGTATAETTPPTSGVLTDLLVADTVDNTYERVGLALDRAQLGKVITRDQAAHSYALDFDSAITTKPATEHHWYSRVVHPFGGGDNEAKTRQVQSALRVNISEESGGARISVLGAPGDKSAPDAAKRVLDVLRERLS